MIRGVIPGIVFKIIIVHVEDDFTNVKGLDDF